MRQRPAHWGQAGKAPAKFLGRVHRKGYPGVEGSQMSLRPTLRSGWTKSSSWGRRENREKENVPENRGAEAGDMAQCFRALVSLAEDLASSPTPTRWPTPLCNCSLRRSNVLFWSLQPRSAHMVHRHMRQQSTCTHEILERERESACLRTGKGTLDPFLGSVSLQGAQPGVRHVNKM